MMTIKNFLILTVIFVSAQFCLINTGLAGGKHQPDFPTLIAEENYAVAKDYLTSHAGLVSPAILKNGIPHPDGSEENILSFLIKRGIVNDQANQLFSAILQSVPWARQYNNDKDTFEFDLITNGQNKTLLEVAIENANGKAFQQLLKYHSNPLARVNSGATTRLEYLVDQLSKARQVQKALVIRFAAGELTPNIYEMAASLADRKFKELWSMTRILSERRSAVESEFLLRYPQYKRAILNLIYGSQENAGYPNLKSLAHEIDNGHIYAFNRTLQTNFDRNSAKEVYLARKEEEAIIQERNDLLEKAHGDMKKPRLKKPEFLNIKEKGLLNCSLDLSLKGEDCAELLFNKLLADDEKPISKKPQNNLPVNSIQVEDDKPQGPNNNDPLINKFKIFPLDASPEVIKNHPLFSDEDEEGLPAVNPDLNGRVKKCQKGTCTLPLGPQGSHPGLKAEVSLYEMNRELNPSPEEKEPESVALFSFINNNGSNNNIKNNNNRDGFDCQIAEELASAPDLLPEELARSFDALDDHLPSAPPLLDLLENSEIDRAQLGHLDIHSDSDPDQQNQLKVILAQQKELEFYNSQKLLLQERPCPSSSGNVNGSVQENRALEQSHSVEEPQISEPLPARHFPEDGSDLEGTDCPWCMEPIHKYYVRIYSCFDGFVKRDTGLYHGLCLKCANNPGFKSANPDKKCPVCFTKLKRAGKEELRFMDYYRPHRGEKKE